MPDGKKRRRIGFRIFLAVLILLYASLILALQSRTFADFYCGEIAPRIANAVGGVMSLIPTAVCEISIAALVCFALIFVILLILLIFLHKREKYRRFVGSCFAFLLVIAVLWTGGELCYDAAMMKSTPVGQQQAHDFDELTALWNLTMTQLNTLSTEVDRDENYHLIHRGDAEIRSAVDAARQKLAADYPRFQYAKPPMPKTSVFSAVVTKFGDSAYFIMPWHETVFTVKSQNVSTYPSIYAHEYSHYSGYYREDEANFFGHLLCVQSDDPNVQYAGWLNIISIVWNAVKQDFQDFGVVAQAVHFHGWIGGKRNLGIQSSISRADQGVHDLPLDTAVDGMSVEGRCIHFREPGDGHIAAEAAASLDDGGAEAASRRCDRAQSGFRVAFGKPGLWHGCDHGMPQQ